MKNDIEEQVALMRSTLRKDLDSVGMIPSGIGIQLITQSDENLGFALMIEAVYIQIFNGRDLEALNGYLNGPLQVKNGMETYLIKSALRVRNALATSKGNGKTALSILMKDKGAEESLMKLLLTTCFNVSKEFNIPFEKQLDIETEFEKSQKFNVVSCAILLILGGLLIWGVIALIRWLFI